MKRHLTLLLATLTLLGAESFTLESGDLEGQLSMKQVYNGFGCKGENLSPALSWEHAPSGTKSFALTVYDPDAPTGSGWWHWVVTDIPPSATSLPAGSGDPASGLMPKGAVQSMTSYGKPGFGGACPPAGAAAHRYIFTIHALDVGSLGLHPDATPALAGYMINSHTIQKASIISYYGR